MFKSILNGSVYLLFCSYIFTNMHLAMFHMTVKSCTIWNICDTLIENSFKVMFIYLLHRVDSDQCKGLRRYERDLVQFT